MITVSISQLQGRKAEFLHADASGMTSDVLSTRKRASLSSEAGQGASSSSSVAITGDGLFEANHSAALSSAIADFIFKNGLCYTISGDSLLDRVIKCARMAPTNYKAPAPKDIGGRYLDVSSGRYETKNSTVIATVSAKFGYSVMSDGATVFNVPFVNVLGGVPNDIPVMFEIADCTEHMQAGGKKDGLFLATLMKKYAEMHSPRNCFLWLLDGASNEQSAGSMLEAAMPWTTMRMKTMTTRTRTTRTKTMTARKIIEK
jgi:hypothetical protein